MARVSIKFVGGPGECSKKNREAIENLQVQIFGYVQEKVDLNYWWLVFDDSTPVAFASLYLYKNSQISAFLSLCGVRPSHRGLGLQRKLVRCRVAKAEKLGASRVISYTSSDNADSANNLIACGFRVYVPRWEWGVRNAIYFRKLLD